MKKLTELLTPYTMLCLLTSAIEGGSNYWYYLPDLSMLPEKGYTPKFSETEFPNCLVSKIWEAIRSGETIPIYDIENEEEKLGEINIESINKGVKLMMQDHAEHYADAKSDSDDATTGDVFFQLCSMGELIYG